MSHMYVYLADIHTNVCIYNTHQSSFRLPVFHFTTGGSGGKSEDGCGMNMANRPFEGDATTPIPHTLPSHALIQQNKYTLIDNLHILTTNPPHYPVVWP